MVVSALATPGDQVAHLAHLGGMLFGFFLIRYWRRQEGLNYNAHGGSQFFSRMKSKWEQHTHKPANRQHTTDKPLSNPDWDYNAKQKASQEEVDRILDKIRKSGYDSLTKDEKQTLFDQSKK